MEKIININFHGRVIPIEEGAYIDLKKYIDSLRGHFAGEESSDEIIHDIENRIAELFSERLKGGAACINHTDLTAVINSIGRLEDIEAADGEQPGEQAANNVPPAYGSERGRYFRNADDKVIAGVCSGIAIRSGIDPLIIRLLFVLLFGALFWIYILLWIIVPAQSSNTAITRRLYRNPDDRYIAGVCSGLAVYFRIDSWIPRLVFALPLIAGIISGSSHSIFSDWSFMSPGIITGSLGSTMFILYIILWIALPYASTATDKLAMRGEKIDMNTIRAANQSRPTGMPVPPRRSGSGLGRVIGILFKAFFVFIAIIIAISLFAALTGLVFAGMVVMPFTDFILDGWGQYAIAATSLALVMGIPLLALATWLIRRIMGVRSHRHYLGYVFGGLWVIGLFSTITMCVTFANNFRTIATIEESYQIDQPSGNRLYINVSDERHKSAGSKWFADMEDIDEMPFYLIDNNTLWLNTVKIKVTQSPDSLYHVYESKSCRGNTTQEARKKAANITFGISQADSNLYLPNGFAISKKDKFRNQQVKMIIEVPLGKSIRFNEGTNRYNWFNISFNGHDRLNIEEHNDGDNYSSNGEYIMTTSGLINPLDTADKQEDEDDEDEDDE